MLRKDSVQEMQVDGCQQLGNTVEVPSGDSCVYGMVEIDDRGERKVGSDANRAIDPLVIKIPNGEVCNIVGVSMKSRNEAGSCMEAASHYGSWVDWKEWPVAKHLKVGEKHWGMETLALSYDGRTIPGRNNEGIAPTHAEGRTRTTQMGAIAEFKSSDLMAPNKSAKIQGSITLFEFGQVSEIGDFGDSHFHVMWVIYNAGMVRVVLTTQKKKRF